MTIRSDESRLPGVALPPLRRAAEQALVRRLLKIKGDVLGPRHRARVLGDALIPGIPHDDLQAALDDIAAGDGRELFGKGTLPPKLHSAYSSAGLALNTFGGWRLHPQSLRIEDESGFTELQFERKLAIFEMRFGAPNLDLVLGRDGAVVLGVESKLTEYLQPKKPEFSDRYDSACQQLAHASWVARYGQLRGEPTRLSFLDTAQLVKHYLGLKRHLAQRAGAAAAILLYLYWEPEDAGAWPHFAAHRAEVSAFGSGLTDPQVAFRALSYGDLWAAWHREGDESLRRHVEALRERYAVRLGGRRDAS
jgi:hypothetical protein